MQKSRYDIAKEVSIISYLNSIGTPPTIKGGKAQIKAFWRGDTNPSVSINTSRNRWHDFGTGESGSIIDLVCKIERCNSIEAVNRLLAGACNLSSFEAYRECEALKRKGIEVGKVYDIRHNALKQYLNERAIPEAIYSKYLKEVHYRCDGRDLFAIGFKNDRGGWVLRSSIFKGCDSQYYTYYEYNKGGDLRLFEGVFDFLTYMCYRHPNTPSSNYLILNSTTNMQRAREIIESHGKVYCYLDNDDGGRNAFEFVLQCAKDLEDCSDLYKPYKDFNEWHVQRVAGSN